MIYAEVVAIDQRYAFGQGAALQNYLVLRLPNGLEVRAEVDDGTVKELMRMDIGGSAPESPKVVPPPPPRAPVRTASEPERAPAVNVEDSEAVTVAWFELDDSVLSPAMKAAFMHLQVPSRLDPTAIRTLEREVREKFGEEEWREVLGPDQVPEQALPAPVPPPAPAVRTPPIGEVMWADGSPMMARPTRSRTVPKDSHGYPILNDGTVDPGEVVGGSSDDADDDGVGSM